MKVRPHIRPSRLRPTQDPEQAFRERARRDLRQILRLAAGLNADLAWHRIAGPLASLEQAAHGLAGAGGTFGYPRISATAAKVERLIERWRLDPPEMLGAHRAASLDKAVVLLADALRETFRES